MKEIYTAFAKAQREFATPAMNHRGLCGQYADLSSILNAVRDALNSNGLGLTQNVKRCDGGLEVTTIITHESGELMEFGPLFMPVGANRGMNGAQAFGLAETYARRYAIAAALGIAADDVDDGQGACQLQQEAPAQRPGVNPELIVKAKIEAGKGMEAYKAFFSALSPADRSALVNSGTHEKLKQEAANNTGSINDPVPAKC